MIVEVNGVERAVEVAADTPLLYVLRNDLGLVGSRYGCGTGQCGACFVIVDGKAMPSCDAPLWSVAGKSVTTVEGLAKGGALHPVQKALLAEQEPQAMLVEFDPIIRFSVWEGALTDLSTNRLDTTGLDEVSSGIVGAGRTADLADGAALAAGDAGSGATISFTELRQYSVFQVGRDAGVPLVLAAAILVLVGLLPALYSSRRKVWVRADPDGDGSLLRVGGLAMQRKPQFEEEFDRLVGALVSSAGGRRAPDPGAGGPGPDQREPEEHEKVQTP